MSNQVIESDLIVDLSTEEQEFLTGGRSRLSRKRGKIKCGKSGYSPSEDDEDEDEDDEQDNGGKSKYQLLVYRPILYRPKYYVRT